MDAATQILFMVGHPVAQAKSPGLLNAWFAQNRLSMALVPVDVPPPGLGPFMQAMRLANNVRGVIFTIPHKNEAVRHVDRVSPLASCVQAVNVARRTDAGIWEADMLDGVAAVNALGGIGVGIEGRTARVVGCGGAGSAIGYALAQAGAAQLWLEDSEPGKADALAQRLHAVFPACVLRTQHAVAQSAHIVVNASPLGMGLNDPLPFDVQTLGPEAAVVDAVTSASRTGLIAQCEARGLRCVTGNTLARVQQPLLAEYFLGIR